MKGKINRGRHTDHPAEYHTMWTNQWTATRWLYSVDTIRLLYLHAPKSRRI